MSAQQLNHHTVKQLLNVLKNCSRHLEQSYQQIGQNSFWHAAAEADDAYKCLLSKFYSKQTKSKTN